MSANIFVWHEDGELNLMSLLICLRFPCYGPRSNDKQKKRRASVHRENLVSAKRKTIKNHDFKLKTNLTNILWFSQIQLTNYPVRSYKLFIMKNDHRNNIFFFVLMLLYVLFRTGLFGVKGPQEHVGYRHEGIQSRLLNGPWVRRGERRKRPQKPNI